MILVVLVNGNNILTLIYTYKCTLQFNTIMFSDYTKWT